MLNGKMPTNTATAIASLMAGDIEMSLRIIGPKQE